MIIKEKVEKRQGTNHSTWRNHPAEETDRRPETAQKIEHLDSEQPIHNLSSC